MLVLAFGLGFFLASISAAFIIRAKKKSFAQTLRATNEAWRGYEINTVNLYELRGRIDELIRTNTEIEFNLKQISSDETGENALKLIQNILNSYFQETLKARNINLNLPLFIYKNPRQWLTDCKQEIGVKLKAIYNAHNKGGLLERKEK